MPSSLLRVHIRFFASNVSNDKRCITMTSLEKKKIGKGFMGGYLYLRTTKGTVSVPFALRPYCITYMRLYTIRLDMRIHVRIISCHAAELYMH